MTADVVHFWQRARTLRARARDLQLTGDRTAAALLVAAARRYDDAYAGAQARCWLVPGCWLAPGGWSSTDATATVEWRP